MFPSDATYITFSDGSKRQIRFTLRTFQTLKQTFGVSFMNSEGWNNIDEDKLPEVIYEALVDKNGITPEQVAELITISDLPDVMEALASALGGNKKGNETSGTKKK